MVFKNAKHDLRVLRGVSARVAPGLGEMSPIERERVEDGRHIWYGPTDPARMPKKPESRSVCPRKLWGRHPDPAVRQVALAQAWEAHQLGPCRNTGGFPLSMFQKNQHTLRIALGAKRQAKINARGW